MKRQENWKEMVIISFLMNSTGPSAKKTKVDESDKEIQFTKRNVMIALYSLLNEDPESEKLISEIRSETDLKYYQDWDSLSSIAKLLYILMYLHCGHPEVFIYHFLNW